MTGPIAYIFQYFLPNRRTPFFLLSLHFLLSSNSINAQQNNFRNYSVEHGLPFVHVYSLYQDSSGYLWSGGYGGLSRFDGFEFKNYTPRDGLANHWVTAITGDKKGNLWVGTINGISSLNNGRFKSYNESNGLSGNHVICLLTDREGVVWVGTNNGIDFYDGNTIKKFNGASAGISGPVHAMMQDSKGNFWFASAGGVTRLNKKNTEPLSDLTRPLKFSVDNGLPDSLVRSIAEDKQGNIWLATPSGLARYDGQKMKVFTVSDGLTDNNINAIAVDKKGYVWAATPNGINRITGNSVSVFHPKKDTKANIVECLLPDREDNLWLGTYAGLFRHRGAYFSVYDEQAGIDMPFVYPVFGNEKGTIYIGTAGSGFYTLNNGRLKHYGKQHGLNDQTVNCGTYFPKDETVWLGTNVGLSMFQNEKFFDHVLLHNGQKYPVYAVLPDNRFEKLWIGTHNGIFEYQLKTASYKYIPIEGLQDNFDVWELMLDKNDRLWIGTYPGGLFMYDGNTIANYGKKLKINTDAFLAFEKDKEGNIYFGTFEGVIMYDGKNIFHFNEQQGMASDLVYCMVFDEQEKYLWVGSNQGVDKVNISKFKSTGEIEIHNFNKEEGFTGVECNSHGAYRDESGNLWFGTVNGLIKYAKGEYDPNITESATIITRIAVFYTDSVLEHNAQLPYSLNNLSFYYTGISLSNPSKVQYRYMLEGYDKNWSPPTKERVAKFSGLRPGKYTFKVISCNNENVWSNQPAMFSFTILRPYWLSWWFWTFMGIVLAGVLIFLYRYRLNQVKKRERELMEQQVLMASNELKALRSQMNPHFMFNSLNSIQHFIINKHSDEAYLYLSKFARLMRKILNNSEQPVITIADELEALKLYIELEALRFDNKFEFSIEVAPAIDIEYHKIPAMLIQPYVENAILHGLSPLEGKKGRLTISIAEVAGNIVCTILDNGIGREKARELQRYANDNSRQSLGMKITKDRLEILNKLHNSHLSVVITDLADDQGNATGTQVEIFIPLE